MIVLHRIIISTTETFKLKEFSRILAHRNTKSSTERNDQANIFLHQTDIKP